MKQENQAIKERLVQAVKRDDKEEMRACLAPDFVVYQSSGHLYGGTYKGANGFSTFLAKLVFTYTLDAVEETRSFWGDDPNQAVFEFRVRGKSNASNQNFDTIVLEYWEFQNGKVLYVQPCWFEIPERASEAEV